MRLFTATIPLAVVLAGCAQIEALQQAPAATPAPAPAEATRPQARPAGIAPPPGARTAEQFDTTSDADKQAAQAAPSGAERDLGLTIASLGAPGEPGFWMKTPLVAAPAKGRVLDPATGASAQVDLIPIDGPKTAGSRLSLAAMRLIGLDLAGLPEVRVYRIGD